MSFFSVKRIFTALNLNECEFFLNLTRKATQLEPEINKTDQKHPELSHESKSTRGIEKGERMGQRKQYGWATLLSVPSEHPFDIFEEIPSISQSTPFLYSESSHENKLLHQSAQSKSKGVILQRYFWVIIF